MLRPQGRRRGDSADGSHPIHVSLPGLLLLVLLIPAVARAGGAGPDPALPDPADAPPRSVGDVTVTATRGARDVLGVPGHVTVIDRQTIERTGVRDVPELLRREAGLHVTNTTTSPEGYAVEARGFNDGGGDGSSLLVLVDGRRVNEAESSTTDWSWLRLDNVERIEVVRGGASALWGDNAVAGVVNIITRDTEGPVVARFVGRTGHDDTDGASLFVRGAHGPLSGSVYLDGVGTDGYRDQSDFEAHRYEGKWRLHVGERLLLGLSAGYSSDERERPGALTDAEIDALSRRARAPGTEGDELVLRRHHVDALAEWTPAEGLLVSIVPWFNEKKQRGTLTFPGSFTRTERTEADSIGVNAKVQLDREIAGLANRLVVGVDVLREDLHLTARDAGPGFSSMERRDALRHLYGGFLQNELDLTERLRLSAGVRYDYGRLWGEDRTTGDTFRTKTTIWSPKAALSWRVLDFASVYAAYSRGFRFPNLDEAFGLFGFFEQGLDPEKANTYEVGAKLRHALGSLDVSLYRMDVDEQILFDHDIVPCIPSMANFFCGFGANLNDPRTVNFPRIQHRGLETSFDLRPMEWLEIYGSYTLQDTRIESDRVTRLEGSRLPVTPRHRGTFGVRTRLPYWWEVLANGNFVGSRFLANDLANEREKLPFYMTWDLTVAFKPPVLDRLTLDFRLKVRNLFDREYAEFGGERTFIQAGRDNVAFFPSPKRTMEAYVGFEVRL